MNSGENWGCACDHWCTGLRLRGRGRGEGRQRGGSSTQFSKALLFPRQTFLPSGPVLPRSPGAPAVPPPPCKVKRRVGMKQPLSRLKILTVPSQRPVKPTEPQRGSCRVHTISHPHISSTSQRSGCHTQMLTRGPGIPCSPIRPGGPIGPGGPWGVKGHVTGECIDLSL